MLSHSSTGVPVVDAQEDFLRARRAHVAARLVHRARVPRTLPGTAGVPRGQARLEVIPLKAVVGTVEPTIMFDARFRPASERARARWARVAALLRHEAVEPGRPRTAPIGELLRRPGVVPALVAGQASLGVMVAVMTLTGPVVVDHFHQEQHDVFPIIAAHLLGMYALVIVVGDLSTGSAGPRPWSGG